MNLSLKVTRYSTILFTTHDTNTMALFVLKKLIRRIEKVEILTVMRTFLFKPPDKVKVDEIMKQSVNYSSRCGDTCD